MIQQFLFGKHQPDQEDLGTNYAIVNNVVPRLRGYGPLRECVPLSSALVDRTYGKGFTARTSSNTYIIFVGTAEKLWRYNASTQGWTDVSRLAGGAYTASADAPWDFEQFGTKVIAVNVVDAPQVIDVDVGTNFAALAGSPPRAHYVKTVGDFLVLGRLTSFPNRVHWSAINNIESWTAGTDSSDFQDFPDGGPVTAITGSDAGYVFQENAVRRMVFTPGGEPNFVFRFEKVENQHGAVAPMAVVARGPDAYYVAQDGFYKIGPGGVINIGFESVNDHFLELVAQTELKGVMGAADPLHPRIYWAADTAESSTSYFNKFMIYDYVTNQWSEAEIALYSVWAAATAGVTLDGLDAISSSIDALAITLDSQVWAGGAPVIAGIDSDFKLCFFQGSNTEAQITSAKVDIAPNRRSLVRKVRPLTDVETPYISVSSLAFPSSAAVTTSETTPDADGMCSQRTSGRYHRFNLRIPAATTWSYALGLEVDSIPDGER